MGRLGRAPGRGPQAGSSGACVRTHDERGFGLLDAVIGIFVLMVVLTPTVALLGSTGRNISVNQFRQTATNLAVGYVNQEIQNAAESGTVDPPGTSSSCVTYGCWNSSSVTSLIQVVASTSLTTATWPAAEGGTGDPVGAITYTPVVAGGWCQENSAGTAWQSWTASGSSDWAYFVVVEVMWGTSGTSSSGSVVESGELPTGSSWTGLPSSSQPGLAGTYYDCPVVL